MKMKFIFCLLSLCSLLSIGIAKADPCDLINGMEITLAGNDIPFEYPNGSAGDHRSIPMAIPIIASLNNNHFIELDFLQSVGEVEIIISQNGNTVYSSSENIVSPILKGIQLSQDLLGSFLLEIKGDNGAYVCGWFCID